MQKLAESVQVIVCTFDTVYGNTAESKLLCLVIVAILLHEKNTKSYG